MAKPKSQQHRGEEHRAFRRWPIALETRCYGRAGSTQCLISEISEAGLTVVTGYRCAVGDELNVAWEFESDEKPFHVTCVVRCISAIGAGVEFLNISRGLE